MYSRFGLVLMVNHACNLRCSYCYTGLKFSRQMPVDIAQRAILRGLNSLSPGGELELGFFGGEPLLEAPLIANLMQYAHAEAREHNRTATFNLTTNGTITADVAWAVMTDPALNLSISFDGQPDVHDRYRGDVIGNGSAESVLSTMRQLQERGKRFNVITVVRPDTVEALPESLRYMRGIGIEMVDLSLDLWTQWTHGDTRKLERALAECADVWRESLPAFGVNWFNEKTIELTGTRVAATARCGYGDGEIAVAPSGRLYPCERLIGQDLPGSPARLPGHVLQGADFLSYSEPDYPSPAPACGLSCRCSNYVRTGQPDYPDGLLMLLDRVCLHETRRVLTGLLAVTAAH